jgi:hypothetical protein
MKSNNLGSAYLSAEKIFTDLYLTFFAMPHASVEAKYRSFETMVENLPPSQFLFWEIVGITPAALSLIAESDFTTLKGVQRAHNMSRRLRGEALFGCDEPKKDAYDFFYLHDRTVLTTKAENDTDAFDRADIIPLENARFGRHTYSIPQTKKVMSYLASVHAGRRT